MAHYPESINMEPLMEKEKNIALIALFAGIIAALGLIPKIDLAAGVPITAQSLGIMLCGSILGAKRGMLAVLLFLLLVFIGLPLLSGGRGGLGVLTGPTVGFIIGFPFAAFVTGWIFEKSPAMPIGVMAFVSSVIGGIIVLYSFGIAGLAFMLDKSLGDATKLVFIFIPGDLIKAVIVALLTIAIAKARPDIIAKRTVK